jgi:hypothetical protein
MSLGRHQERSVHPNSLVSAIKHRSTPTAKQIYVNDDGTPAAPKEGQQGMPSCRSTGRGRNTLGSWDHRCLVYNNTTWRSPTSWNLTLGETMFSVLGRHVTSTHTVSSPVAALTWSNLTHLTLDLARGTRWLNPFLARTTVPYPTGHIPSEYLHFTVLHDDIYIDVLQQDHNAASPPRPAL